MAKFQFNALAAASAVVEEVPVLKENEQRREASRAAWAKIKKVTERRNELKREIDADQDLKLVEHLKRQQWGLIKDLETAFNEGWEAAEAAASAEKQPAEPGAADLWRAWHECQTRADRDAFKSALSVQIRAQVDMQLAEESVRLSEILATLQLKPELAFPQDRYAEIRQERRALDKMFDEAKAVLQDMGLWREQPKQQKQEVVPA